jgi:hypothetical protein
VKIIHIAPAALLFLAACGGAGGDKQAIVDACVEDGSSDKATCECMADAAEKNLDKELFGKLAKAARQGSDKAQDMMEDLKPEEQTQFMSFAMQAAMTCGMGE